MKRSPSKRASGFVRGGTLAYYNAGVAAAGPGNDRHNMGTTDRIKRYLIQRYFSHTGGPALSGGKAHILDSYVRAAPSPQNALDIFKGEWASLLPAPLSALRAGPLPLFDDPRISRFLSQIGGVAGKSVLELGPLEGGHSYMIDRAGASSIISVEANTRAFMKCLIVKELVGLPRVQFLCGDFVAYLEE